MKFKNRVAVNTATVSMLTSLGWNLWRGLWCPGQAAWGGYLVFRASCDDHQTQWCYRDASQNCHRHSFWSVYAL